MNDRVNGSHVSKFMQSELAQRRPDEHRILSEDELVIFRTQLCEAQCNGLCPDPDRCSRSHCLTWQRRNPMRTLYSPSLCPDIEFIRRNSRMALLRRCNRGRSCPYAHSKEEELYHPMVYKTKICKVFPNCKRYHCPFAHTSDELRRRMTAEEYRAAKVAACDSAAYWNDAKSAAMRCPSPRSMMTSAMTTEASSIPAAGRVKRPIPKSPHSVQLPHNTIGHGPVSPRSTPILSSTFPLDASAFPGLDQRQTLDGVEHFPSSNSTAPTGPDPFEAAADNTDIATNDDLLRGLESLIQRISQLQLDRCPIESATATSLTDHLSFACNKLGAEDDYETLWKEIASSLFSGSVATHLGPSSESTASIAMLKTSSSHLISAAAASPAAALRPAD